MSSTGAFEDVVALAPHHEAILRAIRRLVLEVNPGAVEVSRPGDRAVSCGWGPRKMIEAYVCVLNYGSRVNLAFYRGAVLPVPAGRLTGTGKAMRHLVICDADAVARDPAVRDLIIAARDERRSVLGV